MKRITLILGVVAVMVALLVALAAPAMAIRQDPDGKSSKVERGICARAGA